MKLILETDRLEDYLRATDVIDYQAPEVREKIDEIMASSTTEEERARRAFEYARDEICHSFDLEGARPVTVSASQAMRGGEGICFAKAHLMAALLRGMGIPAGFCYQRVTRKGTVESGHALHGLNALYLHGRWFRADPRGNKPGVNAQFHLEREQLAYPIRPELGEVDYPYVFVEPLSEVVEAMHDSADSRELFVKRPSTVAQPAWEDRAPGA